MTDTGPQGGSVYSMNCGAFSFGPCYEKAEKLCPNGYKINGQHQLYSGILFNHTMLIECNEQDIAKN